MFKKLKTRRGMTIAEMLIAVVLLALLTAGGVTAAAAVMAGSNRMKDAASADILASTVVEAISNEIRLGHVTDIAADRSSLTLDSSFFGEGTILTLQDGRLVAKKDLADPAPKQLLSTDTYGGLHLDDLQFTKDSPTDRTVNIAFTVRSSSNAVLWNDSAAAAPMQW